MLCDLSSQVSIRELAAAFESENDRLDVLLNNAGAMYFQRHESVDGLELSFALNHNLSQRHAALHDTDDHCANWATSGNGYPAWSLYIAPHFTIA